MKPDGTKYRVLLVEDDTTLADMYKTKLEQENFDIKHCADGEQALSTALEFHPDLILLDIMLPQISGFDVLDIIRQTPEIASVKVIVITALSQAGDKEKAEQLGANSYLVKSQVSLDDIVNQIKSTIGI